MGSAWTDTSARRNIDRETRIEILRRILPDMPARVADDSRRSDRVVRFAVHMAVEPEIGLPVLDQSTEVARIAVREVEIR